MAINKIKSGSIEDNAITSAKVADGVISAADVADGTLTLAKLSATGTKDATTFLRGDNTFATVTSVGGDTGVDFNDNVKARFGTGNDLEISHDGNNSLIADTGTGDLFIRGSNNIYLQNASGTTMLRLASGASNYLYYNGSLKLETTTSGAKVSGSLFQTEGSTGADATIQARAATVYTNLKADDISGFNSIDFSHNLRFREGTAERMRVAADGKIMINTTSDLGNSQGVLHVKGKTSNNIARFGAGSNGEEVVFVNSSDTQVGSIAVNASSTSYNTSSDYRLKENVVNLDNAITKVKQLQPKRFNFISEPDTTMDGFLAHEVSSIVPEAVKGTYNEVEVWKENEELPEGVSVGDNKLDDEGNTIPKYQGIDQSKLVPLLTASLQEAIAKIEELETRIETLENN